MRKGYLVELNYHDGCDYEAMTDEWHIAVFKNKEDAEAFCRDNSDGDDGYYYIEKERIIQIGGEKPIEVKFRDWQDPDDDNREQYWFNIYEINII